MNWAAAIILSDLPGWLVRPRLLVNYNLNQGQLSITVVSPAAGAEVVDSAHG